MVQRRWFIDFLLILLISASTAHAFASGPEISGSAKFTSQVTQALDLLKMQAPEAYTIVADYVGRIEQGKKSGMWAFKNPPTYEMSDRTAFYSVSWCASTIAHDSFHAKLYQDYKESHSGRVPNSIWTGTEAEKKCLKHQLEVLKKINAPKHEIAYFTKLNGTHYDINKDGKYDWEDYEKRTW
ncbi:MAG: hypothetical protein P8101_08375 [Candidatus Thiodiazotropha sp.]|jgi:hypothetical protein